MLSPSVWAGDIHACVGLNYSEEQVVLVNVTKNSLESIFANKDSSVIIEWQMIYDDGSIDTILVNPITCTFHDFWYPICTQPFHKFIVGENRRTILHLEHRIKIRESHNLVFSEIPKDNPCSHPGFLSMGDGIGTCLCCGASIIYDKKLFERPLHIYGEIKCGKN